MSGEYGRDVVTAYMGHVQDNAEEAVRRLLTRLQSGTFSYEMDNGAVVRVAVSVDAAARSATIDFAGTSAQQPNNFNAPLSVVRAAVLYVVRTLIDDAIPMNDGCLRPVAIVVPEGSMLNPQLPGRRGGRQCRDQPGGLRCAVRRARRDGRRAGHDEQLHLRQRALPVLRNHRRRLRRRAGLRRARRCVQTHMTNSRLTDPEVLESAFPGAAGGVLHPARLGWRGRASGRRRRGAADSIPREPMQANILANRRRVPPFGLAGGAPGAAGVNRVERADGSVELLGATAAVEMQPGDVFVIETPGGGGYGKER